MSEELVNSVRASAERLGISPVDLLTVMSYETMGKLDPNILGGKNNNHLGLIQFGGPEREKYGVRPGMPIGEQVTAAENFLRDRGLKPGMGLLDVYSTVNAGRPGLYGASDTAAGGAPGNVADKVRSMAAHRVRAQALLGQPVSDATSGVVPGVSAPASAAPASAAAAPMGIAPPVDVAGDDAAFQGMLETLKRTLAAHEEEAMAAPLPALKIHFPETALRRSMAARKV